MSTFKVRRIVSRVSTKLIDISKVRWPDPELLADYNALKNTIVALKPDAGAQNALITMVAGSLQTLPSNAVAFRKLVRNMGANGTTPGAAITQCDRDDLDYCRPNWHTETGAVVKNFIPHPDNPLCFSIYPNVATGWKVEGEICATFADSTNADTDDMPFPDAYEDCLFYGGMAMALAKNSKSGDIQKVFYWQQKFNEFLGLKGSAQYQFVAKSSAQEQAIEKAGVR